MSACPPNLTCRMCGHEHPAIRLEPGDRALCVRCDSVLASRPRLGPDAAIAFAITGLILALPAMLLPFITAGKLGTTRTGLLFTGVEGLWDNGMRLLAVWVCLCGVLVPVMLLLALTGLLVPTRFGWRPHSPALAQAASALGHWAMPEVQVLAVLVALIKLGKLVNVTIGPGFWCYGAMSLMLLLAWRSFELTQAIAIAPSAATGAAPPS